MKRLRNFLLYGILFLAALMFFTPKVNLYYLLEEQMEPYGIILGGEHAEDRGFSLRISHATLYSKGIESATVGRIDADLFGLYNGIAVSDILLTPTLGKFFPQKITAVRFSHVPWDLTRIAVEAEGDFGTAHAVISLLSHTVVADIDPSPLMKTRFGATLRNLTKNETGGYRYETRF